MADCWEDVIRGSGEMFIEGEEIVYQSPSKRLLPEECQAPLHMDASLTIDPRPLPKDAVISSQFFSYQERQFVWSNLNDRGMIHGRVHLAVLRDADVRGLIVDVLIVDDDDDTSLKSSLDSHAAYVWQHLISRREAARDPNRVARGGIGDTYGDPSRWHVWSGCFMKWHFLQPHNNVPAEEKMEAARRTMPPGTTFMVYATQFTPRNGLRCKPGYHSFPVFAFPRSLLYRPIITKTRPRYLFVMDFEATCDFAPHPLITPATAEITEFPWVILDLWQLQNGVDPTKPSLEKFGVVGQKQLYVTPSGGQAAITKYCTALTGISWKECGPSNPKAMPLSRAIERFNDLFRRYDDDGGAAVVTDGVWDIQVQLRGEAERKGIVLPQHFRQYFDLKAEFRRIFPNFSFNQREPPLFVMLQGELSSAALHPVLHFNPYIFQQPSPSIFVVVTIRA